MDIVERCAETAARTFEHEFVRAIAGAAGDEEMQVAAVSRRHALVDHLAAPEHAHRIFAARQVGQRETQAVDRAGLGAVDVLGEDAVVETASPRGRFRAG